eukprot:6644221-Alexandrium_andersonii.AAC.1
MGRETQPDTANIGHRAPWAAFSHAYPCEQAANGPGTVNSPDTANTGHSEQPDTVNTRHERLSIPERAERAPFPGLASKCGGRAPE